MPKNKTHSGMSKRVRLTGKGKVVREHTHRQHLFEHKASTRTRRLDGRTDVSAPDVKRVRRLLGR